MKRIPGCRIGVTAGAAVAALFICGAVNAATTAPNLPGIYALTPAEQHAWRVYQDYKAAQKTASDLENARQKNREEMATYAQGGLLTGPLAAAADKQLQEAISRNAEARRVNQERIDSLKKEWDQNFASKVGSLTRADDYIDMPVKDRSTFPFTTKQVPTDRIQIALQSHFLIPLNERENLLRNAIKELQSKGNLSPDDKIRLDHLKTEMNTMFPDAAPPDTDKKPKKDKPKPPTKTAKPPTAGPTDKPPAEKPKPPEKPTQTADSTPKGENTGKTGDPRNEAGNTVSAGGYQEGDRVIDKGGKEFEKKGGEWKETGGDFGTYEPDLKDKEAGSSGDSDTKKDGGDKPGLLDSLITSKDSKNADKTDGGFRVSKKHRDMTKASGAGDEKSDEAKNTLNKGGQDAEETQDESTSDTVEGDAENSWGKIMGDAIQAGITAGGAAFGNAFGGGIAAETSSKIFKGDKDKGKDKGSAGTDEGTVSTGSSGSSSSGGSGGSHSHKSKSKPKGSGTNSPTSGTNTTSTAGTNSTGTTTTTTTGTTTATTADTRWKCSACGSRDTKFDHYDGLYGDVYHCNGCGGTVHDPW